MKTQFIQNISSLAVAALVIGVLVTGCEDIQYPSPTPVTTAANTSARVLFVNATNAPSLATLIENAPVGSALGPGIASTYLPIATNSSQIRVKGAGGTLGANDLSAKQTFAPNTSYTVFITDTINRPQIRNAIGTVTDPGGIRFVTLTDNLAAPAAGNAHVRVLHLAPDPSVAVSVRLQPTAPASSTVSPTFVNRAYRVTTVTSGTVTTNYANFTPVVAGTYTAQVYAGATIPTSATVSPILSVSGVTLADGKIYTLYARGLRRTGTLGAGVVQHN